MLNAIDPSQSPLDPPSDLRLVHDTHFEVRRDFFCDRADESPTPKRVAPGTRAEELYRLIDSCLVMSDLQLRRVPGIQ